MISASSEAVLGVAAAAIMLFIAAFQWLVKRAIGLNDNWLKDHEDRLKVIEANYVDREAMQATVAEIKDLLHNWSTNVNRDIEAAHGRLDSIYSELLKRKD